MGMGREVLEKTISLINEIKTTDSNALAIEMLVRGLRDILREKGIYFTPFDVQLVNITHQKDAEDEKIIIQIYLHSIELWVKITKDYVSTSVYPLIRCEC
jgi:hypothetical protein